jgi:hypothetical protein
LGTEGQKKFHRKNRNFGVIRIVLITMGSPVIGKDKKTFELRTLHENKETCEKSARTFKSSLSIISMNTRCEPQKDDEEKTLPDLLENTCGPERPNDHHL